jgi:predicted acetyltransferase
VNDVVLPEMNSMKLVWPTAEYLPGYVYALKQGWSPDNLRPEASVELLERIAEAPERFLREQVDREAKAPPVTLPDGTKVRRLPGYAQWMWDGEFCGSIGFRWQPGTNELPPHCLGHIGYSVVPWKRRRGYATEALRLLLPQVWQEGLTHVEIVADVDNVPSQRVIEANGGVLVEQFDQSEIYGHKTGLRYRVNKEPQSP